MADIFISYSSQDVDVAKRLSEILEDDGWAVWWDRQIALGQVFSRIIDQELDNALCVVVIWSLASCDSSWVEAEASEGLERQTLVPLQIQDCRIPIQFRRLNTADLRKWDRENSRHPGIIKVRKSVSDLLSGSDEREGNVRLEKLTGMDGAPRTEPKPRSSIQPGAMYLFTPFIDIELDDFSEIEGNLLPPKTIVSGPSCRTLFGFADESIKWSDLYHHLECSGQSSWLEELGRAIYRARGARPIGEFDQRFRSPTDGRVYRPVLYASTALTGDSMRFRILFLEEKEARLPSRVPPSIVQLQFLGNAALEFRYRVVEPFLSILKEVEGDDAAQVLTDLRRAIEEHERAMSSESELLAMSSESELLDVNSVMSHFSDPQDRMRLAQVFEMYAEGMSSLLTAIANLNQVEASEALEKLLCQNKMLLEMMSRSYGVELSKI